jgi:hypothetical protein
MMLAVIFFASTLVVPVIEPLEVEVYPRSGFAPATLRITATVEPHADNRTLTLVADSISYRSSTTVPLEGDDDARVHDVLLKSVPAGEYMIEATLDRVDGTTIVRTTTASVIR